MSRLLSASYILRRQGLVRFRHHFNGCDTVCSTDTVRTLDTLTAERFTFPVVEMQATLAGIKEFEREIAAVCEQHQDFQLFASLPGAGMLHAARLTAAFGTDRSRWGTVDEFLCLSGIAPVMERSGKQTHVRWRYLCPKFLRQSFHEYAGESIKHSFWARAFYSSQRAKGKSHQAAVRALAFKWIRIMYRCWQTRTEYNEIVYLESLRRKGSTLLQYAASQAA